MRRFAGAQEPLERFLGESAELGEKRGAILIQLPPSFAYDADLAGAFLALLRERYGGSLALEPRHPTWFAGEANGLLRLHRIARVAADPALVPDAGVPGGWDGFAYYRRHGSPRTYYSAYDEAALRSLAEQIRRGVRPAWCIFDNTALGAATVNALDLTELLA